jgi:hypothetical protein
MVPLFSGDVVVTSRTDFRRDALCNQVLRLRRADYRDCGDHSEDDATHARHPKLPLTLPRQGCSATLRHGAIDATAASLTDSQLDIIISVAQPIDPALRDPFLRACAVALQQHATLGDGLVSRTCREIQREFIGVQVGRKVLASKYSRPPPRRINGG